MELEQLKKSTHQALAMANNYIHTGKPNKAVELVVQVKRVYPHDDLADRLMGFLFAVQEGLAWPDLSDQFGTFWDGGSLEGKSIEIFCDLSLEDTLSALDRIRQLKERWKCRVVFNCYRHHVRLKTLVEELGYIDEFAYFHVKCDHHTDITRLPQLLEVGFT